MLNKYGVVFIIVFLLIAACSGQIWPFIGLAILTFIVIRVLNYYSLKQASSQPQSSLPYTVQNYKDGAPKKVKKKPRQPIPEGLRKKLQTRISNESA